MGSTKSDERSGLWVIRVPAESGSYSAPVRDGGRLAHMNHSCVDLRGRRVRARRPAADATARVLQAGGQVRIAGQVVP